MKVVVAIVFLAVFCFLTPVFAQTDKAIEYCRLFDSSIYADRFVKTKAILSIPRSTVALVDGPSPFFYSDKCNDRDHFANADYSLNEDSRWMKKIEKDLVPSDKPLYYSVTLEGKFLLAYQPAFGHLGYARAELKVTNIVSIDRIEGNLSLPNWAADSPIYDNGNSLYDSITHLMFDLASRGRVQENQIDTENARITFERKNSDVEEITKVFQADIGLKIVDQTSAKATISKSKDRWSASGQLILALKDQTSLVYLYEGEFLPLED